MITSLTVVHGIVCFLLIVVVLLQFGKGAELGATMGGSSQSIFSTSQKGNILTKFTTILAVLFLLNSVALSLYANKKARSSKLENETSAVPLNSDALKDTPAQSDKVPGAEDSKVAPSQTKSTDTK